ncbi:MAG: acetyltransferase [Candidatus Tagabacteria bacterium RIFCSPLOWO2_01_FULL_39_11]|uniref:Acetyltransferase n=1 Tax=Candidatus Tagabacteria bacterium RIFCSPLOWO2_01_FULL_39_11 TaxID=1802295 RepID=A0A1G2LQB3_9BACT|nr:MAG: acetyltransferase [Candidatus Tagabacteria bacterium RIFCSPLOWO2_01_FULL_39_11]
MNIRFKNWEPPKIEHGKLTEWNWVVYRPENFKLGKKTDIGAFTAIFAHHGVMIEDDVQIGSHCALYSASTIDDKQGPVVLKKNCRIGSHSIVMPGVTVGENTIVGAQSFVNRDLPPNEVWAGSPARFLMTREEYSEKLKKWRKK